MTDVAVVDYGMGNLRSVAKAIEHVAPRLTVAVTSDPGEILGAARVVFPGQGAMPDCMREMDGRGLRAAVVAAALQKPFLGICIGLQMLFDRSEEGDTPGLGLLPGRVRRFPAERMAAPNAGRPGVPHAGRLKVPHMGWNEVEQVGSHPLWQGIPQGSRFYFVHSYYVDPGVRDAVAGVSAYGLQFACAVARENLFAVQFHPEKSQAAGLRLLSNFVAWQPALSRAPRTVAAA
jgi:imidazole glycerol-phosphate synthase subunit HisH